MSLDSLLAKRLGREASPPPAPPKGQPAPTHERAAAPSLTHAQTAAASASIAELTAIHGDASGGGVTWSAWALTGATASDSWLVLTDLGATLLRTAHPVPKPRSYRAAWPLVRTAPWPDDQDDTDPSAHLLAVETIQRAARPCWNCRNLSTASTASSRLPRCGRGHGLVWRQSATRSWPGRLDAADCGDRA